MKNIFKKEYVNDFIDYAKSITKKNKVINKKNLILVELNGWQPFHVASLYLLKALVDKYKCKIIGYENFELLNYKKRNFFENLKWFFGSKFGLNTINIYK